MNRSATLGVIALIALATPALSQGRFGSEAAEKAADRMEREAIRRAEHPELNQPVAVKAAQTTPPEAAAEPAPVAGPATIPAAPAQ